MQIAIKFRQILCSAVQQTLDDQQEKTLVWMLKTPNANTMPLLLWEREVFVFKVVLH